MEETAPKRKAKDNPWYRLATLHGQPSWAGDEVAVKNRVTWNRWMASRLSDTHKTALLKKGQPSEELTPFTNDEWRAITDSMGLSEFDFGSPVDFSNTEFEAPFYASRFIFGSPHFEGATFTSASFDGATFTVASFEGATFTSASFEGATFTNGASFRGTTFIGVGDASFRGAIFDHGYVFFASATFAYVASFEGATFTSASFDGANFAFHAFFEGATFTRDASFEGTTFDEYVFFTSATFTDSASFEGATFTHGPSFINAEMKGPTCFDDVTFLEPPACFNAKLHEGTTWHDVHWPPPPQNPKQARAFIDDYERLKLEMDRLKKHNDELDFFALEQQCRRVVLGRWKGLPIAIYGVLSDYGRSYTRPLILLSIVVVLGAVPLRAHFGGGWSRATFLDHDFTGAGLGLSFANTFSALGIRKELIDPGLLQGLPGWLKVVATVQGILGTALLFLFGLGIRNRFRMK